MRSKQQAEVIRQRELAAGIFDLLLKAPDVAAQARAGQFVDLYCADKSRLLPRPISLAGVEKESGQIRLVYRVSGAGTEEFSRLQAGGSVALLGPLGNGFPLEEAAGKQVLLLGGGIGIPPLLQTAKALRQMKEASLQPAEITAVLGYRDADTFLADEFAAVCDRVLLATEDGSIGTMGTVLDALTADRAAGSGKPAAPDARIFSCGPTPMLRAVKAYAEQEAIPCLVSLEERMACGIGACLACVCRTEETDGHSQVKNRRVCKDGPVFRAEEVVL